jgi:hypothetical protein
MQITYSSIKPLIAEEAISGSMMVCKFKDPDSMLTILSSVSAIDFQSSKSKVISTAKQEAKNIFLIHVSRFLQNFLGSQAGWSASRVLEQGVNDGGGKIYLSKEEKERAVEKAFEMIADQFECANGVWRIKNSSKAVI